ncbi:MAG: hypothetical protein JXR68_02065 [Bacteroidales bacterium]|nr:hypothetical protein [Bacteroidales bacterium]
MKKLLFISGLFFALTLVSCSDISEARDVATKFYEYRQAKDNENAASLCSSEFLSNTSKQDFVDFLDYIDSEYGDLQTFKSSNFHIQTVNGDKITSFVYTVNYDSGTFTDSLALIKKSDGYKLLYYQYELK